MTIVKGFASTFGFKQDAPQSGGTYRTPVLVAAGDGLEPVGESITQDAQLIDSEALTGSRMRGAGDRGNELHNGDMELEMKYEGLDVLLAMVLGTAIAPVQQGADDAYLHEFRVQDTDLEGLFGTLVIDKQIEVWEYPSVKVNSLTISATSGALTTVTANMVASNLGRNTSGGTNNETTVLSITLPANRDFLLWEQLAVRINAQSAAGLAGADLVYPNEFTVTFNNNMVTDDVSTRFGREVEEPCPDNFLEVTGSINFARYNTENNKLVDALFSKTVQKLDAVWTGPLADGATNFSFKVLMPSLQIASGDVNIGGPGRVPANFEFTSSKADTAPTGSLKPRSRWSSSTRGTPRSSRKMGG